MMSYIPIDFFLPEEVLAPRRRKLLTPRGLKMMIQIDNKPGGLAIDPSDVSAVWVETICGDTLLHIVMKAGASHTRLHHPDIGVDAYDLHRQIVEASK